jgi:hypothetical protein
MHVSLEDICMIYNRYYYSEPPSESITVPFSVTAVGELGFPTRPHARPLTLKWHKTALVVSCRLEQIDVVKFVTIGQAPQSEVILYCNVEQLLEITGVQLNINVPDWASAR